MLGKSSTILYHTQLGCRFRVAEHRLVKKARFSIRWSLKSTSPQPQRIDTIQGLVAERNEASTKVKESQLLGWLIFIGLIVAALLVRGAYEYVSDMVQRRRRRKLDEMARDILADFDFDKEKREIKSIGSRYVSSKYRCPECSGMLVLIRGGPYGSFWGCNHYPECKYTKPYKGGI